MDYKKYIGTPKLLNVPDFFTIGAMALLFLLGWQIVGLAWHHMNLLRFTGCASTRNVLPPSGATQTVGDTQSVSEGYSQ